MPTYVKCTACDYNEFDSHKSLCQYCNNSKEVVDPKERLCNLCGDCLCSSEDGCHPQLSLGITATASGNYGSSHLLDMTDYYFSLCEKCLRELFVKCKIKPTISCLGKEESFESDQTRYEYMIWKANGEHGNAYLNGKCNAVKNCENDAIYSEISFCGELTDNCFCEEHKEDFFITLVPFVPNKLKILV
jgi:hypothetical protein